MQFYHIMDKQPDNRESIIHIDRPYKGHYTMGMRNYVQNCTFQDIIDWCKNNDFPLPDFWWISSKDFPFPDKDTKCQN